MSNVEALAAPSKVELTARLVAAFVSNNRAQPNELPALIRTVHEALTHRGQPKAEGVIEKPTPAEIRRSITPDGLTSFIDGRTYQTLRRHLATRGLTPEGYRERYGLPRDYPMTAESYSKARSELAKGFGLGRKRAPGAAEPVSDVKATQDAPAVPKRRGRAKGKVAG